MIVTNNPLVLEGHGDGGPLIRVAGGYREVLVAARDLVHRGHRLVTHPLMGSLKPNETPYRSIVLSTKPGQGTDNHSLALIEEAIGLFDRFADPTHFPKTRKPDAAGLKDFAVIDLSLLESAGVGRAGSPREEEE